MAETLQARSDASALLNEEVVRVLTSRLPETSSFLGLARRLPNVTGNQQRIPVMSVLPVAYFNNADAAYSDTSWKRTTKAMWENKYLNMEELSVIVPMPIAMYEDLRDNGGVNITNELVPYIVEAIGAKVDGATYHGVSKPNAWPDGLVEQATTKGKVVTLGTGTDLYEDILGDAGVVSLLEGDGFYPNGYVGTQSMRGKLRSARGTDKHPIFSAVPGAGSGGSMQRTPVYELDGAPIYFPRNGAFDPTKALLLAGDWSEVVYAIRQEIRIEMFTTGIIQDPEDGEILYNLLQQDMMAVRVTMRLGWQIPNPVNRLNSNNSTRFPFSVLLPVNPS